MILNPSDIRVTVTSEDMVQRYGRARTLHLSDSGGLTQYGVHDQTLEPGASSSERHWHDCEDEFAYVLEGIVTLHDDDGMHDLGPGDAVSWRHGDPNAHRLINRSDAPCRYIIVGSRVARDICTSPGSGRRQVNADTTWQILEADGKVVKGGDLPPELLNLRPVWGTPFDAAAGVERIVRDGPAAWTRDGNPTHPILGPGPGPYSYRLLSDPGGISQFGAFIEELPPGSGSSFRHWHEAEDEMVHVLSGEVVLIEDQETVLRAGDTACWPAGHPVGHCMANRSGGEARYLIIGTRYPGDVIHYPDHDLVTRKEGLARVYFHTDGRLRA